MILSDEGIRNAGQWEAKGYIIPGYDRNKMREETIAHPEWVHFGAGNIFRAFHAAAAQKLLSTGDMTGGIAVVEGYDTEIIDRIYRPYDDLSILVTLRSDGSVVKEVIGSVGQSCILDESNEEEIEKIREIFRAPSLKMATFTITEKGYVHFGKKVADLMYERYLAGAYPIALVSTDNCSHNGDILKEGILRFARDGEESGRYNKGFCEYLLDEEKVSFPWSMIDKITPRPDEDVRRILADDGVENAGCIRTSKDTFTAPFVNAEESEYMVIEDDFPAGRPPLEKAGVIFTDRDTVDRVERMKVCTCLNPLHTSLAVFGCLLGYTKISDEMKDDDLNRLVIRIGYEEGLPVVTDPKVINPREFIDTVIRERIPNPFMPDTPQRIATDTSQKLPIRFGQTIKNYMAPGKNTDDLKMIPLVFAGWIRYLMAVDDNGEEFEPSPDPLLDKVCGYVKNIRLGGDKEALCDIKPLLCDASLFGVDLYEAGIADRVTQYLTELIAGKGAVRKTLKKYVNQCDTGRI